MFDTLVKAQTAANKRMRVFNDGTTTDIYGALVHAIASAGKATVSYQELAQILERDLAKPINGQQIRARSATCQRSRWTPAGGHPAVAYKNDDLNILDPFPLFYLRHGSWTVRRT